MGMSKIFIINGRLKPSDVNPVNKSITLKLLKAFGQQLNIFDGAGGSGGGVSREGETKQGKGGTLKLTKDKSGKGAHWQLANKKDTKKDVKPNEEELSTQNIAPEKNITTSKAYDVLADKAGHKAFVSDKTGNVISEGTFLLANENTNKGLSLIIRDASGNSNFTTVPSGQQVVRGKDNLTFKFSDKDISISLKEMAKIEDTTKQQNDESIENEARKAERMKEWEEKADKYVRQAEQQKNTYLRDLDVIPKENGLEPISHKYRGMAVKSKDSIINKFERNETAGRPNENNKLTDTLRGTIIIKSPKQYDGILASLKEKGYDIWENDVDNLYEKNEGGYKHIAIKLTRGKDDGVVKELLLLTPKMYEAKYNFGHSVYDITKNVDIYLNKMDEKSKEFKRMNSFKDKMKWVSNEYYKTAYDADMLESSKFLDSANAVPPSTHDKTKKRSFSSSKKSSPPKSLIRELRSSLKAIWQPLLASSLIASSGSPSFAASSANTFSSISSIVNPTVDLVNKFASNIINLRKSTKLNNKEKQGKVILTFWGKPLAKAIRGQLNLFTDNQLDLFTGQEKDGKKLLPSDKDPNVRRWQIKKDDSGKTILDNSAEHNYIESGNKSYSKNNIGEDRMEHQRKTNIFEQRGHGYYFLNGEPLQFARYYFDELPREKSPSIIEVLHHDGWNGECKYTISAEKAQKLLKKDEETRIERNKPLTAKEEQIRDIRRAYFEQICIEGEDGEAAEERNKLIAEIERA